MKRALLIVAVVSFASLGATAAPSRSLVQVCQWGGAFGSETGVVSFEPGLTLTPAASDIPFTATGELTGGGRCRGTLTFEGIIRAGSTCEQQWFDGRVKGLPGVARFSGPGSLGAVHEFLYDHAGNIVGVDQPQLKFPRQ